MTSMICRNNFHNDCRGRVCGCICHIGGLPPEPKKVVVRSQTYDDFEISLPISRNTDPETSKEAGRQFANSGKQKTQVERVLEYIQRHPGSCGGKVGWETGIEGAWKRISDAKNAGKIIAKGTQMWRGKRQLAWYAKDAIIKEENTNDN